MSGLEIEQKIRDIVDIADFVSAIRMMYVERSAIFGDHISPESVEFLLEFYESLASRVRNNENGGGRSALSLVALSIYSALATE